MNRIVLLTIVLALFLVSNGCRRPLMTLSPSSFLSSFSLEEMVKKNRSPSGVICAEGGTGGSVDHFSSHGLNQSSHNKSLSFSCQIDDGSFDETAFIESLKSDVEDELNRSGAAITNRGSTEPAGFYFEYSESDIHGRISIGGKKSQPNYYSLDAQLVEKSGAE